MSKEIWETIGWDSTGKLLAQRKIGENIYRITEKGKTIARYKKQDDVIEALKRRIGR